MKIKLRELREASKVLQKVLDRNMPFKFAYRASKIAGKVHAELTKVERFKNDMINKYGKRNEGDGNIFVTNENMPMYLAQMKDLEEEEIDLGIELIPFDLIETLIIKEKVICPKCKIECGDRAKFELSPLDVALLEKFIVDFDKINMDK